MKRTPDARSAIAERLRAAREDAGLSQGQVAKLLGVQRPTISELEAGRRRVSAEELAALAKLYNVSLGWLTGGEQGADNTTVALAARELARLSREDLDSVLQLVRSLQSKSAGGHE